MDALIDSHCHLHYDYSPKTIQNIIDEAKAAGVNHLVTIGTDPASFEPLRQIADTYKSVHFTVGIHPHDVKDMDESTLENMRSFSQHSKCCAIGEIGIDYYYEHSPKDLQIKWCKKQLDLALELNKPVVIHSRDGEDDLLKLLTKYAGQVQKTRSPGVIHCFTGTREFGQACIDLGFYISCSGIITFKKSEELRETVKTFPLDRLLVETDSPYLAPMPYRGKKCEPSMVVHTAEKLAEIKGISIAQCAAQTYKNTMNLFSL